MAVFKCKMCGGDLEVQEGMTVCECEYCGTNQTVPTTDSEKLTNLYNRANRLRFNNEFDKAAGVFENIAAEFPEEAEAYWGLCLCKYGIEYVDDPVTGKKIPTCHRTSLESIFDDSNFELAQEYADSVAQRLYREEAKEIDRLQKAILDIAKNEKPYDIFICYKETAPDGQRTKDSVMAQDIYDALASKGYKVFFARITLEDKLGQEYEPYIFAALSSAKIMLSVGTSYENFNAVWVKNEWSRFLAMMKTDKSKVLIPCYCDCDAYDMPQEFKNLQGQDMGKVGFIQDLVRGIGKIIPAPNDVAIQNTAPVQTQTVIQQVVSSNAENLLKRGMMALEDGKWDEADKFFEQVLNENAEEPRAYFGKMLSSLRARNEEDLIQSAPKRILSLPYSFTNWYSMEDNEYYKKTYRFADDEYKAYLDDLNNRFVFSSGMTKFHSSNTDIDFLDAKTIFDKIPDYPSAKEMSAECEKKSNEYIYSMGMKVFNSSKTINDYMKAKSIFDRIPNYPEARIMSDECANGKEKFYNDALELMKNRKFSYALLGFRALKDYKDSNNLAKECLKHFPSVAIAAGSYHAIGLKTDGTVVATGSNYWDQCNVSEWKDIVAVSGGWGHTVGLKSNGSVVAVGHNDFGDCNVSQWRNIVSVSTGDQYTVGIKSDGTVVATGRSSTSNISFKLSEWTNILAVSLNGFHAAGLKSDGTVVTIGCNQDIECNVSHWKDIVAVCVGSGDIVGLKYDGTVVAIGTYFKKSDISNWKDIIAISAGSNHLVGLKADGTVVAAGKNDEFKCNVSTWTDIVAVAAGDKFTAGLKSDGTVVLAGNKKGFNVSGWKLCTDLTVLEQERLERESRRRQEIAQKNDSLRKQIADLEKQKQQLELEMSEIKGLFAGAKKKKLEDIIDGIDGQIRALNMQITKE